MDLNEQNLITTLAVANESTRNAEQQQAESQLKQWETNPGYYYTLQSIYLNTQQPLQIRWLSIICFKNGIDKYWRPSRLHAISKEEKQMIKGRLFYLLNEKNNQLSIQNAHSIARIVRFEFPTDWPDLFDEIHKNLQEFVFVKNDMTSTNNLLIILNQIIKSLSAVRIGRSRLAMQSKSPIIIPLLVKLYIKFFHEWTQSLDLGIMELCYSVLKNLRRLIPESYEEVNKVNEISEFLKISVDHLQVLINEHDKYSSDLIERYAKCYSKLYFNLISINPTSFILLPCCNDIVAFYLNYLQLNAEKIHNSSEDNDFWQVIALKAFMILKKLMSYIFKKGAITLKQPKDKEQINLSIQKLTANFFNPQIVQQLCDLVINWYLLLTPSDLESWLLEPEEWCNEEISSSWEYQIRPCAENFFQDLIKYFKDELSEYLLNKISNNLLNSQNKILVEDSILCCFQLSADSIADKVNFNQLLRDVFIPMGLKNDPVEYKIIKRRICLIIREWVRIDCSPESRVEVYKFLLELLSDTNKTNDQVVKLSSIQCLRTIIDDWDFNKHDFKPYLNLYIEYLIKILDQMNFTESKLFILKTLAVMIERCNPLVDYDVLVALLSVVPKYWEYADSQQEDILKNSLIRILKNLIICLNENSVLAHNVSVSLIKGCCDSNKQENYQLLSEDGYDLWLSLVQFFPKEYNVQDKNTVNEIFPLINYGLINSTEVLPMILSIIRSYSLLSPELFSDASICDLLRILSGYLPNMRDDSFSIFVALMEILFLQNSSNETFLKSMVDSGLINTMISYVMNENNSIVNANKILLVLSRLAYASSEIFIQMLNYLSNDLSTFLTTWVNYYINNGNPRNKKVNLLALLSLLKQKNPVFMNIFPTVIKNTLLFLEEVQEDLTGRVEAYQLDLIYEDIDDYRYLDEDIKENGEKLRYLELLQKVDPVFTINVQEYLIQVINYLKLTSSEADFKQLVSMCDEYALERLTSLTQS